MPQTLAGAQQSQTQAQSLLTRLIDGLNLTTPLLNTITGFILPTANMWRDPFGGLMATGQTLILTSVTAFGTAALLSSSTFAAMQRAFVIDREGVRRVNNRWPIGVQVLFGEQETVVWWTTSLPGSWPTRSKVWPGWLCFQYWSDCC